MKIFGAAIVAAIALFFMPFLFSCSDLKESSLLALFTENERQEPVEVLLQSDSIRDPYMIECVNNKLYLANLTLQMLISEFDLTTGQHTGDFLSRGQGPDEFLFLTTLFVMNDKLAFWDANKHLMVFVNTDNRKPDKTVEISPGSSLITAMKVIPLEEDVFAATGIIKDYRIVLLNGKGEEITVFGNYPQEEKGKRATDSDNGFAYQGIMIYQKEKKVLAIGSTWGESISFYDLNDMRHPRLIQEYIYSFPQYVNSADGDKSLSVAFKRDNISGVVDFKPSSKYGVCLYSGKPLNHGDEYGGDIILLFDWEGNPVKSIQLDHKYGNIAVNEETQEILLLGSNPETLDFMISKIKLP
jgi:hypothetical protein